MAAKAAWTAAIKQLADDDPKVREGASRMLVAALPRCVLVVRAGKTVDREAQARLEAVGRDPFELLALERCRKAFDLRAAADMKPSPVSPVRTFPNLPLPAPRADDNLDSHQFIVSLSLRSTR
jgi:hypothetical protein